MTIDLDTCRRITALAQDMWVEKSKSDDVFLSLTRGKERGHRMADFVDERTTALLQSHFTTRFQANKSGAARARSMGDVWLKSNGIFNPINVKTGVTGANGQPNLVSLKKLLRAVLQDQIDSYYLLIIKFELSVGVKPHVFLIDMLDHLEYTTYNDGPGQIMLREEEFFNAMNGGHLPAASSMSHKVDRLFSLLKNGNERLIRNRKRTMGQFEAQVLEYKSRRHHHIDQSQLGFADESD